MKGGDSLYPHAHTQFMGLIERARVNIKILCRALKHGGEWERLM